MEYLEKLRDRISALAKDGICIAFSGGVDSSLLLKLAADTGQAVHAVTFTTSLQPNSDTRHAVELAQDFGVIHQLLALNPLELPQVQFNRQDRCYHCKRYLFMELRAYADEHHLKYLVDGTNADDLQEYRPGLKAVRELGVISPLLECGITKAQVRALCAQLGLAVASRPSSPCLATRIPYDTEILPQAIRQIEQGEAYLKALGFEIVRLRLQEQLARIEIPEDRFHDLLPLTQQVTEALRKLGFRYVTLDLAGFKSGSFDSTSPI